MSKKKFGKWKCLSLQNSTNIMKRIYTLIAILFSLTYLVNAQQNQVLNVSSKIKLLPNLPNLKIGDQLPDFLIPKIINSDKSKVRTSDFKDQLLIIDFWSVYCSGCIVALPKMDALQKQFGNKIKILPVTYEPEKLVRTFWSKNKNTKNLTLPTVVEDQFFQSYFRHQFIPHEVWVYKGKVIGITVPQYVDETNIKKVLGGQEIKWPVKNDFYSYNGNEQPLFQLNPNQIDTNFTPVKYAAISDYKEGVQTAFGSWGIVRNKTKKTVRVYFLNQSIYNLYLINWSVLIQSKKVIRPSINTPNQVIWEVGDKSKYTYDPKLTYQEDWTRQNAICFESMNPDTGQTDQEVSKSIISDLNTLLGLNVRWEKREETILNLIRTTKEDNLKSKTILKDHDDQFHTKGTLQQFRNTSINALAYKLNQQVENPYVFDETNYPDKVDMDLDIPSWTDISSIRKSLSKYGLDLKEEKRLVDKLIFTEIEGGLLVNGKMKSEALKKRSSQSGMPDPEPEENKLFLENNSKKAGIKISPSGLQYKIVKEGNGRKPVISDKVIVNYTGTLVNGKIFDSSFETGRPLSIKLTDVIKGWSEALCMMQKGSKWTLYLPAELAYGTHTGHGAIPPNSTLIFEIELLQITS